VSASAGNTISTSVVLTADSTRHTADDKLSLHGQILKSSARVDGVTSSTANQWQAGSRYEDNINSDVFGFGGLDFTHDAIKQLSLRDVVSVGFGYHVFKTAGSFWDVLGGAGYRHDEYSGRGVLVNNSEVTNFSSFETLIGDESSHKLSDSTRFKQRLAIYRNLSVSNAVRITFDAGLSVSISKVLSLTVTLQDRYDSLTENPLKKNDILFFTGINVKFGG
jgi:putative salt-induced outer membrane protein YdiY